MPKKSELQRLDEEADALLRRMQSPGNTESDDPPPQDPPPTPGDPPQDPPPADDSPPADDPPPSPPSGDTDELDGLTLGNARERISNAQARMHRATKEAAEIRRATEATQRQLKALEGQVQRLTDELAAAKSAPPAKQPDSEPAPIESMNVEELKDNYPELHAKLIAPLVQTVTSLQKQIKVLGGQVGEVTANVTKSTQDVEQERKRKAAEAHFAAILDKHKDAFEIVETDDFRGWLDRQPSMYRRAIDEGDAKDVIEVLDKYKDAVGTARLDRARAVAQPSTPRGRESPTTPQPTFTRAQIAAMTPEQFSQNEKAIDEAMAKGLIR